MILEYSNNMAREAESHVLADSRAMMRCDATRMQFFRDLSSSCIDSVKISRGYSLLGMVTYSARAANA